MKGFYFDEHLHRSVADALTRAGITVVMAVDVDMTGKDDDSEHLPYATSNDLVMVMFDHPFAGRTMSRRDFVALVCLSHSVRNDVGAIVELLTEFSQLFDPERDTGQVFWLP